MSLSFPICPFNQEYAWINQERFYQHTSSSKAYDCAVAWTMSGSDWRLTCASASLALALSYGLGNPSNTWKREDGWKAAWNFTGKIRGKFCVKIFHVFFSHDFFVTWKVMWNPISCNFSFISCGSHEISVFFFLKWKLRPHNDQN